MGVCSAKKTSRNQNSIQTVTNKFFQQNIRQIYCFKKVQGTGTFGTVKLAYLINDKEDQPKPYAIKTIQKSQIQSKLYLIQRELDIMRTLDHPNIIRFYETYEDDMYIHFVMEFCQGGELLDHLLQNGQFSFYFIILGILTEQKVAYIMKKLFSACDYIHSKGIAHRDLKPENLLLSSNSEDAEIKIIDFGLSKKLRHCGIVESRRQSKVGTPLYVAPEVLNGHYSFECDNWSLGCIMYFLLCGETPFFSEDIDELIQQIKNQDVYFNQAEWRNVSKDAKEVIIGLLQKQPNKRLTSSEALKSNWMKKQKSNLKLQIDQYEQNVSPLKSANIKMLNDYANASKLKKESLKILLKQLKENDIKKLTKKFEEIDEDNLGFITVEQLQKVMKNMGFTQTEFEIQNLISRIFQNTQMSSKTPEKLHIKYSEFIAAMLDTKIYMNKERMWQLFKYFDSANKNYLEVQDLRQALEREGRELSDDVLNNIIEEIDRNKDGKVDFQDFCKMMHQDIENEEFILYFEQNYASPSKQPHLS